MILSGSIVSHKTKAVEGLITPGCSDPKGISVVERRCWLFLSRPFTEKIITVVTMTVDADSLSRMKHAGFIAEGEDKSSRADSERKRCSFAWSCSLDVQLEH